MGIETKDLLRYLRFSDDDIDTLDMDGFKRRFDNDFTLKEEVSKITGHVFGSVTNKFKQILQDKGVDFVNSDVDGKKFEEIIDLGFSKMDSKYKSQIDELKARVGTGTDKQDEALLKKIAKLEEKEGEWSGKYTTLENEYNNYKTSSESQFKNYKLKAKEDAEHANLPWAQGVTEVTKRGFFATVNDMVSKDLDETDNIIVKDKTGNPIPNPAVNNTFKTYKDVLTEVGIKEGVFALNPHSTKQVTTPVTPQPRVITPPVTPSNGRVRQVAEVAKV